jgi:crotonobetainyl-CoA:carnitine CoA-transferase CaiB-like acyl-CoA transferase
MPARISPWAIYDVFTVKDDEQIFLAAVSDAQWLTFCDALGFDDLKADPALKLNNDRVRARPTLLAELGRRLKAFSAAELSRRFEAAGLPFAPIMKPEQLLDDPHLTATGGLADIRLTDGERAGQPVKATLFPFTLDGQRPGVRLNPPKRGEHTREVLAAIGVAEREIDALVETKAVA